MTLLCQRKMVKESWRLLYSKNEKCTKKGQRDQGKNVENELTERYLREEIGNERSVSRMRVPGLRVAESTAMRTVTRTATSAATSAVLSAARLRLQTKELECARVPANTWRTHFPLPLYYLSSLLNDSLQRYTMSLRFYANSRPVLFRPAGK